MKKLVTVSLALTLVIVSMTRIASAAERTTKHHYAAATSEQVRNARASVAPFYVPTQDDFARMRNGAQSAPAGR
jgi:hypothetical protein